MGIDEDYQVIVPTYTNKDGDVVSEHKAKLNEVKQCEIELLSDEYNVKKLEYDMSPIDLEFEDMAYLKPIRFI